MRRITSALFLDFDNIFSGLLALDRDAALALAKRPGDLIERLSVHALADDTRRDLLVRRAYLNPNGTVQDALLGNENGRLYLGRFRPHLVRAGYEVIDCPALTARHKNAADIRIVIDVLAALDAPVRYDEIIVASSDADFTPLLVKLRSEDRRTTIITAGVLAPAYQAVADRYIDVQSLISLLVPSPDTGDDADAACPSAAASATEHSSEAAPLDVAGPPEQAAAQAHAVLTSLMSGVPDPVNLAFAGSALHQVVGGDVIRATNWFGHRTLTEFIKASDPDLRVTANQVWDPSRHEEPAQKATPAPEMPTFITDLRAAIDMPLLPSASWDASFRALAEYAATHTFALTEATAWTRDRLAEQGHAVGRQVLGFIIRGCLFVSVRLDAKPPPTATELREAFTASITERARSAGLEHTQSELDLLERWLTGTGG